ncbi:MAG: hypothetical protein MR649_05270 [Prevotella sp.]|nr:hypothetical protein [Prevotella sp.]
MQMEADTSLRSTAPIHKRYDRHLHAQRQTPPCATTDTSMRSDRHLHAQRQTPCAATDAMRIAKSPFVGIAQPAKRL